ncbi:MAG: hypothetical protein V2I33_23680 [Kangiellaceae bacterium]|jgi:hypothetical protein|nr:hypothetical protein [Kangiellaceae bacterium]
MKKGAGAINTDFQKLKRSDPDNQTPAPNFKGQRRNPFDTKGPIAPSKRTTEARFRRDPRLT